MIVLGDDEALPLARRRVGASPYPQDHGAPLERQLRRILTRDLDHAHSSVGRDVAEAPTMGPGGEVRDDVDLFPRVRERALERSVVVRRHEELMRQAALAEERR